DIRQRFLDGDVQAGGDELAGLLQPPAVAEDQARHDQGLRFLAGLGQMAFDQNLIQPFFFHFLLRCDRHVASLLAMTIPYRCDCHAARAARLCASHPKYMFILQYLLLPFIILFF
ncbi:MAG: hypothetical protein Q8N91_01375, partial [Candidatus Omnitrophota bacterium]|nr:hypothetical protein [Candidatus Omnitrophota bacterium]